METEKPRSLHVSFEKRVTDSWTPASEFVRTGLPLYVRVGFYATLLLFLILVVVYGRLVVQLLR